MSDETRNPRVRKGPLVVGLGEVLFDCFPDARYVGGAPLNLAVHCDALLRDVGGSGVLASAIGDDLLGRELSQFLAERSLDPSFVQVHPALPTGLVTVTVAPLGQPRYLIEENVAWDHLHYGESWRQLARTCSAVSFGTLAQRSLESRAAIYAFLSDASQAVRFFDANLRQSFYSPEVVRQSLDLATAAKFNVEELGVVNRLLGLTPPTGPSLDDAVFDLMRAFRLDWVAVSRGSEGTSLFAEGRRHEAPVPLFEPVKGADSVGAGDACGAGLLIGALLDWPHEQRVALANELGAYVNSRPGASPVLPRQFATRLRAA
jgi:fructokinase